MLLKDLLICFLILTWKTRFSVLRSDRSPPRKICNTDVINPQSTDHRLDNDSMVYSTIIT